MSRLLKTVGRLALLWPYYLIAGPVRLVLAQEARREAEGDRDAAREQAAEALALADALRARLHDLRIGLTALLPESEAGGIDEDTAPEAVLLVLSAVARRVWQERDEAVSRLNTIGAQLGQLRTVALAMAYRDPMLPNRFGEKRCYYCNGPEIFKGDVRHTVRHQESCAWMGLRRAMGLDQ